MATALTFLAIIILAFMSLPVIALQRLYHSFKDKVEDGHLYIVVQSPTGTPNCFCAMPVHLINTNVDNTDASPRRPDTLSPLQQMRTLCGLYVQNLPNRAPSSQGAPSEFTQLSETNNTPYAGIDHPRLLPLYLYTTPSNIR
jgi:hypothetical protein